VARLMNISSDFL